MSETAQVLRGKFAGVDLDELVDWPVVRTWLYWGMFWLMVTPSVGVLISGTFNYPDYIGSGNLELTFGRLRPVHVNGVIFGALLLPRAAPLGRPGYLAAIGHSARMDLEHRHYRGAGQLVIRRQ
jgi:hypothetical protein